MDYLFLSTGEVHSPFFLFIRHSPTPSDGDILSGLGCGSYQRVKRSDVDNRPYLIIGHTEDWTMVADDWSYTLWHADRSQRSDSTTGIVEPFQAQFDESFACRWPDVDDTFSFSLWRRGRCVRLFDLIQDGWTDPITRKEAGPKLPVETDELASRDVSEQLAAITRELGYVASDAVGTFRIYAGLASDPSFTRRGGLLGGSRSSFVGGEGGPRCRT